MEREGVEERIESGDQLSTTTINGRRLTWRELVEHYRYEADEAQTWHRVLSDLSRCEHGRHAGDARSVRPLRREADLPDRGPIPCSVRED